MRQLFLEKGNLSIKDICEPVLDQNSILVSVNYSYMSAGSGLASILNLSKEHANISSKLKKILELKQQKNDIAKYLKEYNLSEVVVFGHTCSGSVLAVGSNVNEFRVGDLVACAGSGFANHADIISVPASSAVRISSEDKLKQASLVGLGSLALNALKKANLHLGDSIGIFGLDSFGQMLIQFSKLSGLDIFGFDIDSMRLGITKNSGALQAFDLNEENLEKKLDCFTKSLGLDCIIISPDCNSDLAYDSALKFVKPGGKIILTGNFHSGIKFKEQSFKEVDISLSLPFNSGVLDTSDSNKFNLASAQKSAMNLYAELLESGKLNLDYLLKEEFLVENAKSALKNIKDNKNIGALINFKTGKRSEVLKEESSLVFECIPSTLATFTEPKIGILGYGRFAQNLLLPALKKLNGFSIESILDEDITKILKAKKAYKNSDVCVGGFDSMLATSSNVIFVSPSVDLGLKDILNCLNQGKALYLACPPTLLDEEILELSKYLASNPKAKFSIGFYKSYSSLVASIKEEISGRNSPMMINYRFHVSISPEEKTHMRWKHGRMRTQGAHILDLMLSIVNSAPVSISVESIRSESLNHYPVDNFVAQLAFSDGSVCSLILTSLGAQDDNERMEIFYDSKTILLDEFTLLKGYGIPATFGERLNNPDDGSCVMIKKFMDFVTKPKSQNPTNLSRFIEVAKMANIADKMLFSGGSEIINQKNTDFKNI